jgi:hypothetical protein
MFKKIVLLSIFLFLVISLGIWRLFIYTPSSKIITKVGNQSSGIVTSNNKSLGKTTITPKTKSVSNSLVKGDVTTNGKTTSDTIQSTWITSASGEITVQQPVANSVLLNGDYLVGTAKVNIVSYTLIDDRVGVVSQGSLNVVNGKFSGSILFTPHSSGGRLDVYSTNGKGVEFNQIQIGVRF